MADSFVQESLRKNIQPPNHGHAQRNDQHNQDGDSGDHSSPNKMVWEGAPISPRSDGSVVSSRLDSLSTTALVDEDNYFSAKKRFERAPQVNEVNSLQSFQNDHEPGRRRGSESELSLQIISGAMVGRYSETGDDFSDVGVASGGGGYGRVDERVDALSFHDNDDGGDSSLNIKTRDSGARRRSFQSYNPDDVSDYQNADYGNLDHIYGSRADIYSRQDKLYGQDSPYRNPDSIMGNQDNIFGDPGNLFRDPGNLFGNQDSCYANQDNIFGTQDSSYGNKDSISGTLDSCYGNQDNRTQNKCYQSQDLNSGNHSDGLINMMKRIDLETKKIEKEVSEEEAEARALNDQLANIEVNNVKLEKEEYKLRKTLTLLELVGSTGSSLHQTTQITNIDARKFEVDNKEILEIYGLINETDCRIQKLNFLERFFNNEKKTLMADLRSHAQDSDDFDKTHGPGLDFENLKVTKEELTKQYRQLRSEIGEPEELDRARSRLIEDIENIVEQTNQCQEEIEILQTLAQDRDRILNKLRLDQQITENRLRARKIRMQKSQGQD